LKRTVPFESPIALVIALALVDALMLPGASCYIRGSGRSA
jgi:hypothetical protein